MDIVEMSLGMGNEVVMREIGSCGFVLWKEIRIKKELIKDENS